MEKGSQQNGISLLLLKLKDGTGSVCLGPLVPYSKPQETINHLKNHFLPHCHKIEITECLTTKLQRCLDYCLVGLDSLDEVIEKLTIEVLRALRWCATDDTAALNMTMSDTVRVLDRLIVKAVELESNELLVKIAIQVLVNLLSGSNEAHKQARRAKIQSDIVINHYIDLTKYCYEVSALLYNLNIMDSVEVLNYILKNHSTNSNEYLEMLMVRMVQCQFVWLQYSTLPSSHKLDILHVSLTDQLDNVPKQCLDCLANSLIASGNVVFQVSTCTNSVIQEVGLVLELLAHLSSREECLTHLSGNKDLLINAGVLLINVHRLGQTSGSVFKPVQKIAELQAMSCSDNPVFGFKAHLIKLIGNLCWKNTVMQDLVREAELIPVLLDCCNVDANNPFIMQWAIFAIRNLCDRNQDNQKIIAGMTQKQFVNSGVLEEFGLTLHTENGSSTGLPCCVVNKINESRE